MLDFKSVSLIGAPISALGHVHLGKICFAGQGRSIESCVLHAVGHVKHLENLYGFC